MFLYGLDKCYESRKGCFPGRAVLCANAGPGPSLTNIIRNTGRKEGAVKENHVLQGQACHSKGLASWRLLEIQFHSSFFCNSEKQRYCKHKASLFSDKP